MTTLTDVLQFINTATTTDRNLISLALSTAGVSAPLNDFSDLGLFNPRAMKAAATLSAINVKDEVTFPYDNVIYTGIVRKINRTTAKVEITKMDGISRNRIRVGTEVKVGASILARAL